MGGDGTGRDMIYVAWVGMAWAGDGIGRDGTGRDARGRDRMHWTAAARTGGISEASVLHDILHTASLEQLGGHVLRQREQAERLQELAGDLGRARRHFEGGVAACAEDVGSRQHS